MPLIKANNLELFYDEFGHSADPAIVLIMGLGTQMIAWSEDFCGRLASHGFRVIRFDNRDIGLSTKMEGRPRRNLGWAIAKAWMGLPVQSDYSLSDMAGDVVGLMDALGVERAHIVGASMGGMIAQIVAANYPLRCLSLTSMQSTSGDRRLPGPRPAARTALTGKRPPASEREAAVEFGVKVLQAIASPAFPTPDSVVREYVEMAMARSVYPQGFARQLQAVLAGDSRVELLKTIRAPTLVLHGDADPLVPVEGGIDTAKHIPGARLTIIPGWAHDLPLQLTERLTDEIAGHCAAQTASLGEIRPVSLNR